MAEPIQMPDNYEVDAELQVVDSKGNSLPGLPDGASSAISLDSSVAVFVVGESLIKGVIRAVSAGQTSVVGTVTFADGKVATDTLGVIIVAGDLSVRWVVGTPRPQ